MYQQNNHFLGKIRLSAVMALSILMLSACSDNKTQKEPLAASEESNTVSAVTEVSARFSGNAGDQVLMEDYGYLEGERYVLYLEKGTTLPGNLKNQVEEIMRIDEQILGLSFSVTDYVKNHHWREVFLGDAFQGIQASEDKVQIMIARDQGDGAVEWSDTNEIMLFDWDFDPEYSTREVIFHELAHVLRLRQSPHLGQVLEEGIGCYAQYHGSILSETPCWSCLQYMSLETVESRFDDSVIIQDPEAAFREYNVADRNAAQPEYQYGFRFVSFLMEEYGDDILQRLSATAAKYQYLETDNDKIIEIIKEATSEDVFERFAKWLPEGWKRISENIKDSLRKYGY